MGKKTHRNQAKGVIIGVQVVGNVPFSYRSCRTRHFLPLLACLFCTYVLLSYLSPPIREPRTRLPIDTIEEVIALIDVEEENVFRVPSSNAGASRRELWVTKMSQFFYSCSNCSNQNLLVDDKTRPNRYLLIETSGGLNQQRTGIVDAVIAAYILNATLVIPILDENSYWKDASKFEDIFDVDWFISLLAKDVKIIKKLPEIQGKTITPYIATVPRKCDIQCYQTRIVPLLTRKYAVELRKFDYRLSNRLPTYLQKLRCKVNYHGLQFTQSINVMGLKLVERMRMKSKHFVALHLRFEPDMLAFSGCDYGGGEKENADLNRVRKRWKSLQSRNPDRQRRQGKCPLTPGEVGLMLRALGYGDDVHIYVASGEIYGGNTTMAPLKAMFPNIHTKETLASAEELKPFNSYSSRMAALDYIVCDESDAFVTNNNGNMARILAGRRRYFGHKPTIRPNAKKLGKVFMERENMTWGKFSSLVEKSQIGFMGEPNEIELGRGDFHEHPLACICKKTGADIAIKALEDSKKNNTTGNELMRDDDDDDDDEANNERDLIDLTYMDKEDIIEDDEVAANENA